MSSVVDKILGADRSTNRSGLLRMNAHKASVLLGEQLFEDYYFLKDDILDVILSIYADRHKRKDLLRSNSGSITIGAAVSLALFAIAAAPRNVAEVGTYIGCSTAAIGLGGAVAGSLESIDSCDINPAIQEPLDGVPDLAGIDVVVHQTDSTSMFKLLKQRKADIDFLHIDGRVNVKDIELLKKILSRDAVIALDDCESDEKGHVNLDFMRQSGLIDDYFFVQPFPAAIFRTWGIESRSTTGFLLPMSSFEIRRQ